MEEEEEWERAKRGEGKHLKGVNWRSPRRN